MNRKKISMKVLAVLMATMMLFGVCTPVIHGLGELDHDHDDKIHYVSLGASNTNGYGIRGYLPAEVTEDPLVANKANMNVYGYEKAPVAAYPYQVAQALESATGKDVVLNQLAISSMRVEEVRMLLDDTYYGDAYTAWRFYDRNGNGWFAQAESGNANDGATALANLRRAYQTALTNADVISVDMGLNNFGVFAFNNIKTILADGDFWKTPDFSQIMDVNEELNYRTLKASILEKLTVSAGMTDPDLQSKLDMIADTLAYAALGFCYNFDIVIEEIYALNPDATVVVVSIQNMLHGVNVEFEGMELPLGDLYGELIDMVNLYTAKGSPYCEDYVYAYAGENGHATTFLDELLAWDGDPASLTDNMKDCFDMYDDGLYVRSIIEYMMVGQALSAVFAQTKAGAAEYGVSIFADDKYAFTMPSIDLGKLDLNNPPAAFVAYVAKVAPHLYNIRHGLLDAYKAEFDSIPNAELKAGIMAQFNGALNGVYEAYRFALNYAYGVVATVVREVALIDTIQISSDSLNGFNAAADGVMGYIFGEVVNGATQNFQHKLAAVELAADPGEYVFTMDKTLLEDPALVAVSVLAARYELGNSFFAHPNEKGHDEITEAILDALANGSHGDAFAMSKLEIYLGALADLVSEHYDEAYALAYEKAVAAGKIAEAIAYIDEAIAGLNAAIEAVENYAVDTELAAVKAELINELNNTLATLSALKADLADGNFATVDGALATLLSYEDELDQHLTTIWALADEIGFAAGAYVEGLAIAARGYAELLAELAADAYAQILESVEGFAEAYDAFVEYIGGLMDELDETIGSAVREFLSIRPAEVLATLCAYGKDAVSELIALIPDDIPAFVESIFSGDYVITEDSYYVAIVGSNSAYADILAEALDVAYSKQTWGALDMDALAKADLITIGYNEADLNGFAANQVLGYLAETLDGELRDSVLAYADEASHLLLSEFPITDEAIDMCVDEILVRVNAAVDTALDNELIRDKSVVSLDWTALVGEENLTRVDAVRDMIYAEILAAGIPETYTMSIDVVAFMFANPDAFGAEMSEMIASFDRDSVYTRLGEKAYYTLEISAAEPVLLAIESFLYGNMTFGADLAETMKALNEINPDAAVAVLGQYNPFDTDFSVMVGNTTIRLGDAYGMIAALGSAHPLYYAATMANVTYVDISDVQTVYEKDVESGAAEDSVMGLLMAYLTDPSSVQPDDAGNRYIVDRILKAYTISCGHTWADATCTEAVTCVFCGATEGEALGHTWTDATCIDAKTCSVCGGTEGDALGHTWTDATCTVAKTCSVCGATEGEALGHAWTDATCTDAGVCAVCGATEGDVLGHTWTDATCTASKTCAVCGVTEGDALGHTWTDATCTASKTCAVCGATEGDALGHTWTDATCTVVKICSVCGETEGDALGHTWTDATCTEAKTCAACGETEGTALGHDWASPDIEWCKVQSACARCGATEGEDIEEHTYTNACDTDCDVCGATRTPGDHAYGEWTIITEATKKAEGKQERACSVCGHVVSEAIPPLKGCASVLGSLSVICAALLGAAWMILKRESADQKKN